jgi:hypothetical protein
MSNVKPMRVILALLVAGLLPVAAGCGESGTAGGAASVVPADVAVYVSVDTSFEGGQWRTVAGLLEKFPDGEGALEELLDEAAEEAGLDGDADLRGALGPELAFAMLPGPAGTDGEPPVVLLTQPEDEDAWSQLFEDGTEARAEVDGWQIVAQSDAVLDLYREALEGSTLDDSEAFAETMDDLPEDSLARLYANGEALAEAVPELGADLQQLPFGAMTGDADAQIGAALRAEDEGVRIEGHVLPGEGSAVPEAEAFRSELVEEVPARAVAFLSFNNLGAALTEYADMLGGGAQGAFLPFDLDAVGALLQGETAVYVSQEPAVTLVTEVDDEAAALQTVDALVGLAGKEAPIVYDAFDGLLVVSSSQKAIAALRSDGPRLDQDDRFEAALADAGMPAETAGFGYVDIQTAAPLFLGLAGPRREKATELDEYLEPLGGAVFWGEGAAGVQRFSVFVGIE